MLKVTSAPLELRGIASKQSAKGNMYYMLNVETEDGSPHSLYCKNRESLPDGLKKGDMICIVFDVANFRDPETGRNSERLVVSQVMRVE